MIEWEAKPSLLSITNSLWQSGSDIVRFQTLSLRSGKYAYAAIVHIALSNTSNEEIFLGEVASEFQSNF